jgi:hypothetical protein
VSLDPEDVEAIAARVVELLLDRPPLASRAADAATVARELGVDRDWVYAHAEELGAARLGGPRGRLRFDLARILRDLSTLNASKDAPAGRTSPATGQARRRAAKRRPGDVELIPYAEVRCTGQQSGRRARKRPRPDTGRHPDVRIP